MDFKKLREEKEHIKVRRSVEYHSWRKELQEEEHPYVEVCPEYNPKANAKKEKLEKEVKRAKDVVKEERARTKEEAAARLAANKKAVESGRDSDSPYLSPKTSSKDPWSTHPSDANAHRKEDIRNADKKAKEKKEVKEERKDERGLSADEKSIGRSIAQGMNPLDDYMAGATRQRLSLANRGKKKKRGVKEEAELVDEAAPAVAALAKAAAKALAPTAKAVAKDVAVSGIKDAGERAKKAIHNRINPDKVEEMVHHRDRETPEEKSTNLKWKERHDAQYARGAKERRERKPMKLRKGEVRWQDKETGEWKSNKDA